MYHPVRIKSPPRRQQHHHFEPYDAPQPDYRSYRPPQQEPIYQQRTEPVARMSCSPDHSKQIEYSVSLSNQVTQQPLQQFAHLPPSGSYCQEQLQYEQNQPCSTTHYRRCHS